MSRPKRAKGKANRQARRQGPKASAPPPQPARTTTSPRASRLSALLSAIRKVPPTIRNIMLVVGVLGAGDAMFASPEIHLTGSDPASPFVFPFSLKNDSALLTLENVEWDCIVSHMEFLNGSTVDDVGVRTVSQQTVIAARETSNHVCRVINQGIPIHKLSMDVTVHYAMLHYWKRTAVKRFTWIADGQHSGWVEGNVD